MNRFNSLFSYLQAPFDLFKEKLDMAENLMQELVRPLDNFHNEHNTIITLLCGYSYYSPNAEAMEKQQFQKFEYMLERLLK